MLLLWIILHLCSWLLCNRFRTNINSKCWRIHLLCIAIDNYRALLATISLLLWSKGIRSLLLSFFTFLFPDIHDRENEVKQN